MLLFSTKQIASMSLNYRFSWYDKFYLDPKQFVTVYVSDQISD
jgi:hypothetical protein